MSSQNDKQAEDSEFLVECLNQSVESLWNTTEALVKARDYGKAQELLCMIGHIKEDIIPEFSPQEIRLEMDNQKRRQFFEALQENIRQGIAIVRQDDQSQSDDN